MLAPRIDPKYEIVRKLREGGMGAIYLVRHRLLDELRVVKVLRSHLDLDEDLRQRFLREAKSAIHLRHPNIAQLYDFSLDEEGNASIVLEYIDGLTLEEFGRQPEARNLALDLAVARQALRALAFLHRKGFVHRDVAPDNLMLTRDAEGEPLVKLIDLGIVKVLRAGEGQGTATSLYLGKPRYSSPEQLTSPDIDARSDLYSFGILLYELVTGCYPIRGHDLPSLIAAHLHGEPMRFEVSDPDGRVPPDLRALLWSAMAKDPADRPASAEELSARLDLIARELPAPSSAEVARLIDAARSGARRERERELGEAGRDVLSALDRGDFAAARARLTAAVDRLGNDPELAGLADRIEERDRAARVAAAESERLGRLAAEAEAALAARDYATARTKVTEVLARRPHDARARLLASRIDSEQRDAERRQADQDTPTAELREDDIAPALATARTHGTRPAAPGEPPRVEAPSSDAPRPHGQQIDSPRVGAPRGVPAETHGVLRALVVGAFVVALGVGGWLLWRGMTGRVSPPEAPALYREALVALGAEPERAARLLREQLLADAVERPGYLPNFHYALALSALGQCDEALKALAESERQGALAGTPEAALVPTVRGRCGGEPDLERELAPVASALATLERQIAEIEGTQTSTEIARVWTADPKLGADLARAKRLVEEARTLADRARAGADLNLAYQAADRAADARSALSSVLAAVERAIGRELAR